MEYSIGDTVTFDWKGYTMLAFILRKTERISILPWPAKVRYSVEMNFNRTLVKNDFDNMISDGIVNNMSSAEMSSCRIVLTEKNLKIFTPFSYAQQ